MEISEKEEKNQVEFYRQTWTETKPAKKNVPGVPGWLNWVPNPLFKEFFDKYIKENDPSKELFLDVGCAVQAGMLFMQQKLG